MGAARRPHDRLVLVDLLIKWAVLAIAVWLTTAWVDGFTVDGGDVATYLLIAAVLAVVNGLLGGLLRLLTFPLIILTLGVFSLVITACMLLVTDWLMDSFDVDDLGTAFIGAIVIAIITVVLELVLAPLRRRGEA